MRTKNKYKMRNSSVRYLFMMSLSALVLASPLTAFADTATVGTIDILATLSGGQAVNVTLTGGPALCSAVTPGSTISFGDLRVGNGSVTSDGMKAIYATLLAAKLSGRTVTIYATNGTTSSFGCIVTGVHIH
jgi:hypothetical protein